MRQSALELPAGEVATEAGDVLVRLQERRDLASEFAELPLVLGADGTRVRIGDVGEVHDTFSEDDIEATYQGEPALELVVYRIDMETPIGVSRAARAIIDEIERDLPDGASLAVWDDQSKRYEDRLDLLARNAVIGLGLVLLLLGLFLEPRVAFWVTMGIVISVVGSFIVFPATGATINMVSLFAFIVTLGIIVDDAIIVGENIFELREKGMDPLDAAIEGARQIAMPVVFAVLTNVIAFMPLFFVPGATGKIFLQIPAVVVSVFVISLVESLFILPAHLAHATQPGRIMRIVGAPNRWVSRGFERFSAGTFAPLVTLCLRNRYFVPALGVALLLVSFGFVGGGKIRSSFLPRIDSDVVTATARLPVGVPIETTREIRAALEAGARRAAAEDPGRPDPRDLRRDRRRRDLERRRRGEQPDPARQPGPAGPARDRRHRVQPQVARGRRRPDGRGGGDLRRHLLRARRQAHRHPAHRAGPGPARGGRPRARPAHGRVLRRQRRRRRHGVGQAPAELRADPRGAGPRPHRGVGGRVRSARRSSAPRPCVSSAAGTR